ncbi:MAG: LCP family protein [Lachnospiraceae bacterium]|nr:LCP family protein [Lachnospiraceae bacterium]
MGRRHRGHKSSHRTKKIESRNEYILKRVLIIIGCILAVGVILVAAVKIVTIVGRNRLTRNANTEGPSLTEEADSVVRNDPLYASDWQEGWVSLNGKVYEFNKDIRTFLVLGIDNAHQNGSDKDYGELTAGGQADGIFLVIMNPLDETIKILAVDRNTIVDVLMVGMYKGQDVWEPAQICTQHAFGGGKEYSCELTRDAVSRLLFDVPIHGYAAVQYTAIPSINDAVGGVELTLPEGMDVTEVNKAWKSGATITLKGQDAYDFIHYRNVDVFESQRERVRRHKLYLKTFIKKVKDKTKEDITFPVTMYKTVMDETVTDLTVDTMGYMASEYYDYSFDEDDIYTMEGHTEMGKKYEEFYPDEDALRELFIKLFYKEVDRSN